MPYARGTVICSKKGRDKGYFLAVISSDGVHALVCDGKERPIERPKRKNLKHISPTDFVLSEEQLRTNKSLKRALHDFRTNNVKGEI